MGNWIEEIRKINIWKKYSQCGEEAYIDYIFENIKPKNKFIVELGAWDGQHLSNAKFFEEERGYERLMIDGDNKSNLFVKQHWILKENISSLLKTYNCPNEFAMLSIDLDGNDYYIIEEILKSEYKPDLIVAEINGKFPIEECATIPYNPEHTWKNDDYYGMSLGAFIKLCNLYEYTVIFQNYSLNAYAVRNKHISGLNVPTIEYCPMTYHVPSNNNNWVFL